jgi:adenine-specific DNA-methyltransferase
VVEPRLARMVVSRAPRQDRTAAAGVRDVAASVLGWWSRRVALAGLDPDDRRLGLTEPPVPAGRPLEALDEAGAFDLGEAYVRALDPGTRLREGRHYTPERLAECLWAEAEAAGADGVRVSDPAAGAGALLLPPLRQFVSSAADPETALAEVPARFAGLDLDPFAVWLGNAVLAAELLPLWARLPERDRPELPRLLRIGDGLAPLPSRPRTIVMNPPYGRVRLENGARARWQASLFGHANRYSLFVHAALEQVADGGVVAAVLPTSFLGGAYYQRLRAFVADVAPLVRLTFVDSRSGVFAGDVLQETCLAVFRKGPAPRRVACARVTVNGAAHRAGLPSVPLPRTTGPWLLPRRREDGSLIAAATRAPARLSDYGWRVSTGPLVWNRHKQQISARAGARRAPIVWAADLDGGGLRRAAARDHLRWIALRPQDAFMKLREPAILVQRTTAPEQARRLVAARLDSETLARWGGVVVVENHVNVLRSSDPESPLTPELLEALFRTTTVDRLYRCLTGSVAVSAFELGALPLPGPATLLEWRELPAGALGEAVARYYRDEPS